LVDFLRLECGVTGLADPYHVADRGHPPSIIENMFEKWNDAFSAPLRRVVDPPSPVLVDLNVVLAAVAVPRRDAVSMRAKSAGLDSAATVPGLLHAWAGCNTRAWIGWVWFAIPTADRKGWVETWQWCSAHALTPNGSDRRER
jgi:hypothetical protein